MVNVLNGTESEILVLEANSVFKLAKIFNKRTQKLQGNYRNRQDQDQKMYVARPGFFFNATSDPFTRDLFPKL